MKLQNNWPKMGYVDVLSGPKASKKNSTTQEDNSMVVILEVVPNISFYIGYKSIDGMYLSSNKITLDDGKFGMKLGADDVSFFAFSEDMQSTIKLSLVEYSNISNPKYKNLVVF